MNRMIRLAVGLVAAASLAVAASAAPPPADTVQVRVEKMTYEVRQAPPPTDAGNLKPNPKLTGKSRYTTEAVVVENRYVRAVVLPEFGARLVRVTSKKSGRDLFWVNDVLEDYRPWATGGSRFSFPACDGGRHMDEGAGRRIVKEPDGSVTVAMDMRFTQYAGETGRYGRFSALRQATSVRVHPGSAVVEYTARVDNRLPLRHGFRLWNVAQFPREAGAEILFPVGSVMDDEARSMHAWPVWDGTDHGRLGEWGATCFGVDMQGDWVGVYYPKEDANHLILKPRYTALGTRLAVAERKGKEEHGEERIEIGNGSNPTVSHPGHYLPPFGTYVMPLGLVLVTGIGRVDWANEAVAVSYKPGTDGGRIRIVGFEERPGCSIMARTKQETVQAAGTLRPDEPIEIVLTKPTDAVLLTVRDGDDNELAEVRLPWKAERTAEDVPKTLQGEMRPEGWLAAELADEVGGEDGMATAAQRLAGAPPADAEKAVHAARLVMRTERPGTARWAAARDRLKRLAFSGGQVLSGGRTAGRDASRYVHAYLGMMLALEAGGKVTPQAAEALAKATRLPAVRYLVGLESIGSGNPVAAATHLKQSAAEAPTVTMGLGENALEGSERLHPAATVGGQWPGLVRAALLMAMERPESAIAILERMLVDDPARPEALALEAEALTKANRRGEAQKAEAEAEGLFRMNEEARRDYEAIRREAREGVWSGIPRPSLPEGRP